MREIVHDATAELVGIRTKAGFIAVQQKGELYELPALVRVLAAKVDELFEANQAWGNDWKRLRDWCKSESIRPLFPDGAAVSYHYVAEEMDKLRPPPKPVDPPPTDPPPLLYAKMFDVWMWYAYYRSSGGLTGWRCLSPVAAQPLYSSHELDEIDRFQSTPSATQAYDADLREAARQ